MTPEYPRRHRSFEKMASTGAEYRRNRSKNFRDRARVPSASVDRTLRAGTHLRRRVRGCSRACPAMDRLNGESRRNKPDIYDRQRSMRPRSASDGGIYSYRRPLPFRSPFSGAFGFAPASENARLVLTRKCYFFRHLITHDGNRTTRPNTRSAVAEFGRKTEAELGKFRPQKRENRGRQRARENCPSPEGTHGSIVAAGANRRIGIGGQHAEEPRRRFCVGPTGPVGLN